MKTSPSLGCGKGRGFTLIELLVVVAIMSCLMGLSLSAYGSVIRTSRKTAAVSVLKGITVGVSSYLSEYSRTPVEADAEDGLLLEAGAPFLRTMLGQDEQRNPRSIAFLDSQSVAGLRSHEGQWALLDPWGEPFQVWLDADDSGWIANPDVDNEDAKVASQAPERLPAKVLAASSGPDKRWSTADDVVSWR